MTATLECRLTFDEASHSYRLNGEALPSVTTVLGFLEPVDRTPAVIAAGTRGTIVHDACEFWDRGELNEDAVDDDIRPYLTAYQAFRRECAFETIDVEVKVYHPLHLYAGRVDRVVAMNGKLTILDLKSGAERRTHPIQLAAYREAYRACCDQKVQQAACVYLRADGSYSLKWQKDPRDLYTFLAALTCYRWRSQ